MNSSSKDVKLSKTQLSKIMQFGGCLGPLMKFRWPLMKNVLTSLLMPVGLTPAASSVDARIHNKISGYETTELIISSKEVKDIMILWKTLVY